MPPTDYDGTFWRECRQYHDLAREYERHIETTHPKRVTTDRLTDCVPWSRWARTAVTYREYRGPNLCRKP